MRNTLHQLVIAITLFFVSESKAQCPTALFSAPDSACKGTSVLFSNTSTGNNLSFNWDFNAADSRFTPIGALTGTYPSEINSTTGIDYMQENNNIIAINLTSGGEFSRMEYGSSLSNIPIVTKIGNLGVLGSGNRDFVLIKDNSNYHGILVNAFSQVYRIDFGNSLMNIPTATLITIPSGLLATAFNIDIKKMGNDFVAIIANNSGGTASIINFGSTMMNNTPTAYNITLPHAGPIAATLVNDCGRLYGIVAYVTGDPHTIIDFGTSVTPTPVSITSLLSTSGNVYRKICVIHDGYNWFLFGNTFGGDNAELMSFGNTFANPSPIITHLGNIGAFGSGRWSFNAKKIDSEIGGIVCDYNTGDLTYFKFPQFGNVSPTVSTDTNPLVSFNDTGKFIITLSITDTLTGNRTSIIDSIYISDAPTASFVSGAGCSGTNTSFTSTSIGNPVTYNWDFGDSQTGFGQNVIHNYATSGSFDVTLVAISSAGCSDTTTTTLIVNDPPQADFTYLNNQCAGASVVFNDISNTMQGSINNWTWVFNTTDTLFGQAANYSFNADGQYPIQLFIEATTGCVDTIQQFIDIIPGPINSFEVRNTCLGETTQFLNTTTITGGLSVNYEWIFDVNDTSLMTHPSFLFPSANAANYNVFLTATATNGCVDTLTQSIHIGVASQVDFSIDDDTVCTNSLVLFSDSSIISPGEVVTKILWDFGDGSKDSTQSTVSHLYSASGAYIITLTVQTESHCVSSLSKTIHVIESPTSNFSLNNVCDGTSANFNDLSTSSPLSQITNWNWNFGDSTQSTTQHPMHQFPDSGIYIVTLTAIDNNGCSNSFNQPITIYALPLVNFSNSKSCTNNSTSFTDSTQIGAGISTWQWNFGDGSATSNLTNPQHTYTTTAAYPVTLVTTTTQGCVDSITKLVLVEYSPEFTLQPSVACFGSANQFGFTITGLPVTNPGYSWDFGDSTASSQSQPSHLYSFAGTREVIFILTNIDNGCLTADTITSNVIETPIANFISDSACIGDSLHFINTSTSAIDPITQWNWTSSYSLLGSTPNQNLLADTIGNFNFKLIVTTSFGCKDSITKVASIFGLPQTSFTTNVNFGSPPLSIIFTNTSDIGNYTWNFGDGSATNNNNSPTHLYNDTGKYVIVLTNTSNFGCTSTFSHTVQVLLPYIDIAVESCNYIETSEDYEVYAILRNLGNITIENFNINAYLQSKSPISEQIENLNLKPGDALNFKFNTKFLKDEYIPDYLCVEVVKVNQMKDAIESNNETCTSIRNTSEIFNSYPNPTSNSITIPINATKDKDITMNIYDMYGKIVKQDITYYLKRGFNRVAVDFSHFSVGSYILKITEGDSNHYQNIIKR